MRDYLVQCVLWPASLAPPVLGIRVDSGSLGGRQGHQYLGITVRGVIMGRVVIMGGIIGMITMIIGMVVILMVITVIMGMMVMMICFYQSQGEDGGEVFHGVWCNCQL